MSVNTFLNAWISTNTAAGGYSLRNEGTTLLNGTVDISGQINLKNTTNVTNRFNLAQAGYMFNSKKITINTTSTSPYTLQDTDSGATVVALSTSGTPTIYLPSISASVSYCYYIYVRSSSASGFYIARASGASSNSVRPLITNISYATTIDGYALQPGQSAYVWSDLNTSTWHVEECARNAVENVWTGQAAFRGEMTVLDLSGVKRSLRDFSTYAYYDSTTESINMVDPTQTSAIYVGQDGSSPGNTCASLSGDTVYMTSGYGGVNIGEKIIVSVTSSPAIRFNDLPTYTGGGSPTPTSNQFITRSWAEAHLTLAGILSASNSWTGTNAYSILPTYSGSTAPTSTSFITKSYADTNYASSSASILPNNNSWSGTNTWSNTATFNGQLNVKDGNGTTKDMTSISKFLNVNPVEGNIGLYIGGGAGLIYAGADFTVPTNTVVQIGATNVVMGADQNVYIGGNVVLTGDIIPTYTGGATPTTSTSILTKGFADSTYGRLSTDNTWAGIQDFSTLVRCNNGLSVENWGGTLKSVRDIVSLTNTNWSTYRSLYLGGDDQLKLGYTDVTLTTTKMECDSDEIYINGNVKGTMTVDASLNVLNTLGDYRNMNDILNNVNVTPAGVFNLGQNDQVSLFSGNGIDLNSDLINVGINSSSFQRVSGQTQYLDYLPSYDGSYYTPGSTNLITKSYADSTYAPITVPTLTTNNTWNGVNNYSNAVSHTYHPTYSGASAPTLSTQYTPKSYVDTTVSGLIGGPQTWTGTQTFSSLPVYSGGSSPSSNNFITKSYADSTYAIGSFVDLTTNQTIGGVKTFTTAPVMSGGNITAASIPNSALATSYVDVSNTQTVTGAKTFSNTTTLYTTTIPAGSNTKLTASTPTYYVNTNSNALLLKDYWHYLKYVLNDASAVAGSVDGAWLQGYAGGVLSSGGTAYAPQIHFQWKNGKNYSLVPMDVSGGVLTTLSGLTASATQTINFGSNAPTMSGANIASGTIPTTAVASGFVNTTTAQTIGGTKTFSTGPVMSGSNIQSNTIPTSAINANLMTTDTTQTGLSGSKTWTSGTLTLNGASKLTNNTTILNNTAGEISNVGLITNTGSINQIGTFYNSSYVTLTTSQTLSGPSIAGRTLTVQASGAGITLTLPSIGGGASGVNFYLAGDTLYNTVLQASAGESIRWNGSTTSSITIGPRQTVYVQLEPVFGEWIVGYMSSLANDSDIEWTGTQTFSGPVHMPVAPTPLFPATGDLVIGPTAYGSSTSTTGNNNLIIGSNNLDNATNAASLCIAIGNNALQNCVSNSQSTAIGYAALQNQNGGYSNTAIGPYAGLNCTTGYANQFIGPASGMAINTGINNFAMGPDALSYSPAVGGGDPNFCVAIGAGSIQNVGSGCTQNTAVGYNALNGNGGGYGTYLLSGQNNVGFGYRAGMSLTGASNACSFFGANSDVQTLGTVYTGSTAIGAGATITASNQVVLGRSTETVSIPGTLQPTTANASPRVSYIVDTTITATQSGYMIELGSTAVASRTFTLPAPSTANLFYTFTNLHANNLLTITTPSGIFNQQNGAGTTSVYVWANADIMVRSNGTNWIVEGGLWDCMRLSYESVLRQPSYFRVGGNPGGGVYAPFEQGSNITATATLTAPLKRTYMITSTTSVNITLPVIASSTVGAVISFRKLSATINIAHNIIAGSGNSIIAAGTGNTAVSNPTSTPLLSATSTALNYLAVDIVCISTTQWAIMA